MKSRLSLILSLVFLGGTVCASAAQYFIYPLEKSPQAGSPATAVLAKQYLGTDLRVVYRTEDTVHLASPRDPSTRLEHNLVTGEFHFERSFARYLGDFAPKLPSADEAAKIGQEFLAKNGILPANLGELKLAHVGGLRAQNVVRGIAAGPVVDKLVTLSYSRVIDGLPVIGPGSKFVINIGNAGEVVGLDRQWREVNAKGRTALSEKELFTDDEVYALAKRQILTEFGKDAIFEIRGKGPCYYDNNGTILQPVFTFEAQVITSDDGVVPANYLCVIPLLRRSPEPLALTALDPKAKELIRSVKPVAAPIRPIAD